VHHFSSGLSSDKAFRNLSGVRIGMPLNLR
jgi:hypothetical protein